MDLLQTTSPTDDIEVINIMVNENPLPDLIAEELHSESERAPESRSYDRSSVLAALQPSEQPPQSTSPQLPQIEQVKLEPDIPVTELDNEVKKVCGFLKENGKVCKRKLRTGEAVCQACAPAQALANRLRTMPIGEDIAAQSLFTLQLSAYMCIETISDSYGVDLTGLSQDLVKQKESFERIFKQMYVQYGPEYIDRVIGPVSMWGILSSSQLAVRYKTNLKKNSDNS